MIREKIKNWSINIWDGVKSHPVELVVLVHLAAALIAKVANLHPGWWAEPIPYAFFAFVMALSLSFYRDRLWAKISYWLVLPIYALCSLFPERWLEMPELYVFYAIAPLVYLLSRGKYSTDVFRVQVFRSVRSLVVAIGIGCLVELLLGLIYLSTLVLFDLKSELPIEIISIVVATLLIPILFIGMEYGDGELNPSRLEGVLVNYVLMPAVMIYNVVLYVYMFMIVVKWDLPKGSVAVMIMVFMFMLVLVGWLRQPLRKQPLMWYFRWSGLFALPLVVLFWVAVGYRVGQYGLTIDRCLLVGVGIVMVLYVVLSLLPTRKVGHDVMLTSVIVLAGVLLAVGGPLSARQFSKRSQMALVRQSAEKIGILTKEMKLSKVAPNDLDSIHRSEYRTIYQAMRYLDRDLKCDIKEVVGMTTYEYLNMLSPATARYAQSAVADDSGLEPDIAPETEPQSYSVHNYKAIEMTDMGDYNRLYAHIDFENYKIKRLGNTTIDLDSVLVTQLALIGLSKNSDLDWKAMYDHSEELCTYRSPDGRMIIIFDFMVIEESLEGNRIKSGRVSFALLK